MWLDARMKIKTIRYVSPEANKITPIIGGKPVVPIDIGRPL
jgi:hypothetical protein